MDEELIEHAMTYAEREALKDFARRGTNLEQMLVLVSNWMACGVDVTFSGYASHWAAARTGEDTAAIRAKWPLKGPRMIADNRSDWGSAIE